MIIRTIKDRILLSNIILYDTDTWYDDFARSVSASDKHYNGPDVTHEDLHDNMNDDCVEDDDSKVGVDDLKV